MTAYSCCMSSPSGLLFTNRASMVQSSQDEVRIMAVANPTKTVPTKPLTAAEEAQAMFKDVLLERSGKKIVLPNDPREMTTQEGINFLHQIQDEENAECGVHHQFECFPMDGAIAFHRATCELFGHPIGTKTPPKSFFDSPKPPVLITVDVGVNDKVQVPWGSIKLFGIDGRLETGMPPEGTEPRFYIRGEIKKKNERQVAEVAARTEKYLKENSIYKGKAIRVGFDWLRDQRDFNWQTDSPKFIDVSKTNEDQLIFAKEIMNLLNVGLFAPIKSAKSFRKYGIPLKRGVLLTGPYGCGKTLTAYVTAKLCEDNGFTFLYLKDVRDLPLAFKFAKLYSPCVIFAEDVDISTNGPRDPKLNELLNVIDGVDYKDAEIITILTTNHAENINKAFLRPGRIDTVIPVLPPDQEAAARLIRLYGGDLLAPGTDITPAAKFLAGQIPATIRECVERSKIATLARTSNLEGQVTADDLIVAMKGMEPHMILLNGAKTGDGPSAFEVGLACVGAGIAQGLAATAASSNLPPILKHIADMAVARSLTDFIHVANANGTGSGFKSAEEVQGIGMNLKGEVKIKDSAKN